jgi:hypothetical protein
MEYRGPGDVPVAGDEPDGASRERCVRLGARCRTLHIGGVRTNGALVLRWPLAIPYAHADFDFGIGQSRNECNHLAPSVLAPASLCRQCFSLHPLALSILFASLLTSTSHLTNPSPRHPLPVLSASPTTAVASCYYRNQSSDALARPTG